MRWFFRCWGLYVLWCGCSTSVGRCDRRCRRMEKSTKVKMCWIDFERRGCPPLCLVLLECVGSSYHVYTLDILIVGMVVDVAPVE